MTPVVRSNARAREYLIPEGCFIAELSNGPDDEAVSIARARVPPGVTTRWHRLSGTAERYVVLTGTGRVQIGDLPAQELTTGDVALIPPDCRQRLANTGREDLVFLAICTPRFRPGCYQADG